MQVRLRLIARLLLTGGSLLIAGCGHEMLRPAPRLLEPIPVVYTGNGISNMEDLPSGTYRIPDSDVVVSGHQKASRSPASLMFGVMGVLVANEIDKSGGKSAVQSAADALRLKLSPEASVTLESLVAEDQFKNHFTALVVRGKPELDVSGSIVLTFIDQSQILPYVVLRASLKQYARNPEIHEPSVLWSTRYMSSIGGPKPLVAERDPDAHRAGV